MKTFETHLNFACVAAAPAVPCTLLLFAAMMMPWLWLWEVLMVRVVAHETELSSDPLENTLSSARSFVLED